jgi:hypothetical protein
MIFKDAFLTHGVWIVRENIPNIIINQHFTQIDILTAITQIGILPLILGLCVVYKNTFDYRKKSIFFFTSLALVIFFLLLFKLIKLDMGLIFLGVTLTILSAQGFTSFFEYVKHTRFARLSSFFLIVALLIILLTSIIPTFIFMNNSMDASVSQDEIDVMQSVKENTEPNSTILATLEEGHLITGMAERKNVMDSKFMMIKDPEERIQDAEKIYASRSKTSAIRLLNKYEVNYILLSDYAKQEYGIEELDYASSDCFDRIKINEATLYKSKCAI